MEKIVLNHCMDLDANDPLRELRSEFLPVSYTHLTLPTTPYV